MLAPFPFACGGVAFCLDRCDVATLLTGAQDPVLIACGPAVQRHNDFTSFIYLLTELDQRSCFTLSTARISAISLYHILPLVWLLIQALHQGKLAKVQPRL